jgi:ABC-type sugar transport system ATPase subunit
MPTSAVSRSSFILEMQGITKRFPGVTALSHVDLSIARGEMHALIGQNGAGKSTLMKILAGVYTADEGEIYVDGRKVNLDHPRESMRLGIGTVYQELSLAPNLCVADNIFLGREPSTRLLLDEGKILRKAEEILERLGLRDIDVRTRAADLPLMQQQLVEIAKVLSYEPRILVLDEPTASLAEEETANLFKILHGLKEKGISIIFISHRFKEIIRNCDRGTILRNGKLVRTLKLADSTEEELVEVMIGQQLESFYRHGSGVSTGGREVLLEAENLSVGRRVHGVSFKLFKGEIVGLTGLLGAGQNDVARALFGVAPGVSGTIRRNGKNVTISSPDQAIKMGICLLTEDRKSEGLFMDMSVKDNITLPSLSLFQRALLFINGRNEQRAAEEFIQKLNIVVPSIRAKVGTLSGGNQQKAILGRWLLRNLDILIFIEPTRGIDIGAKAEIYHYLDHLSSEGKSILVISPDLLEIIGLSDRILVMYNGKLTSILDKRSATEENLLSAIQGGNRHES